MKVFIVLFSLVVLLSCKNGNQNFSVETKEEFIPPILIDSNKPIPNNQNADQYKVLFVGNSHVINLPDILLKLLKAQFPEKQVSSERASSFGFLDEAILDEMTVNKLRTGNWSHVILQGQKYSQSGARKYPTTAAKTWIQIAKDANTTPILFPEHPQKGNSAEGQYVHSIHTEIAQQQLSCVAPVGLAWDRALEIDPSLHLHTRDGNHAALKGNLLTSFVIFEMITGQQADLLPLLVNINVDEDVQSLLKQVASEVIRGQPACFSEP